jgi:dolichol-phosphate mannosyltransferase
MDQSTHEPRPSRSSLLLVLYGNDNGAAVCRAVHEAEVGLIGLPVDYEILVIGGSSNKEVENAVREEAARNPAVRYAAGAEAHSYVAALQVGLAASAFSLIALSNGGVDLRALRYAVPLVEEQPIVIGYCVDRAEPLSRRLLFWAGNAAARLLMGTRARDCGAGASMSLFQRSVLPEILPHHEGPFVHAEILARARGGGLPVAEVPVSCSPKPDNVSRCGSRAVADTVASMARQWWRFHFPGSVPSPAGKGSWLAGLLLALLAALLLFPDNQPLLEPDEGRQAEIPREMLAHGDYLLPRIQGLPYHEKPPLQYWLTAGAYAVLGVRPWVARLVPATSAWLGVLVTFAWARRALGSGPAFLGTLLLCLSLEFVLLGRTVTLDSLLALCVGVSWYAAQVALSRPGVRWSWWAIAALACGLGVLVKGPVALILVVPPVAAYQWLTPAAARPRWPAWIVFVGLTVLVPAPWYVAMGLRDPAYLAHFLWKANIVRFVNPYDHEQAWWFYLPVLFVGTFPWSLLWAALGYFLLSHHPRLAALRTSHVGYCVLLTAWCIGFFSLSGCKSPPYVLPALAPLALLLGSCLHAVLFVPAIRRFPLLASARGLLPCHATIALLLLAAAIYAVAASAGWQTWEVVLAPVVIAPILALACWRYGRGLRPLLAWGICAAACLGFLLFPAQDLGAGYAVRHSPVTVARIIRHRPASRTSPVVSFQRTWPSASFYLRREITSFYGEHLHKDLIDLLNRQPEVLVLVENDHNLNKLLDQLGDTWAKEVVLPDPGGTVALVIVRQRGRASPGL